MSSEATTSGAVAASGKKNWPFLCGVGGLVFLAIAIFGAISGAMDHNARPAYGLLVMFTFYLSIGLGMLLLNLIHHVFGAGWSTVPRRQVEHATSIFPVLAGVFAVFLIITYFIDNGLIWKWIDFEKVKDDVLYTKKSWYLNNTRFLIGVVVCFAGWIFLSHKMRSYSAAQDKDGDVKWTNKLVWWSAVGVIFTALTLSMAAIDWIKSIEFHWFSTMFGVWFFAASMRAALAITALVCLYQVYKNGPLTGLFKRGHLYDLGCLMLAFTVFWAYISFSQYFLIYNAKMTGIVKQLSRLASETQIAVGELVLDDLIERAVDRFKEEHEIEYVELHMSNPELKLQANRETFEDVVSRLMENAMESYHRFDCDDPIIRVETDEIIRERVEMLRIRVTDNGKGVPNNIRDNIFEPFVTIKAGIGCGMGLTVARHSARSLRGEIDVQPNPEGQGTVSTFYHPIHAPNDSLL
ncbi:HAMP domain-containing histidine kinase [Opitutales bacterium]|nr:HAMP domain-containing histidine kinase [Opitutales bacterium]